MGREVRKVPADWQHPKNENGHYIPLLEGPYSTRVNEWDIEARKWEEGFVSDYRGGWNLKRPNQNCSFTEWNGERPIAADYMPEFPEGTATHYMMYETVSEGTPISPSFATPEALARWLSSTGASACGDMTASYESWLRVCCGGYAPSMVIDAKGIRSGVDL